MVHTASMPLFWERGLSACDSDGELTDADAFALAETDVGADAVDLLRPLTD